MVAAMTRVTRSFLEDHVTWRLLRIENLTRYLKFCARPVVAAQKPFIIGVTGSVGKSTTTAMIGAVLSHPDARPFVGTVGTSQHNMNDSLGLPLVFLGFDDWLKGDGISKLKLLASLPFRALKLALSKDYPRTFVLEYGTSRVGGLRKLVDLAPPDIAVVTTIGPSHLERLRTVEGVAREKSTLVRGVRASGLVILGDDHEFVDYLEQASPVPVQKVSGRGVELSRNIARVVGKHMRIPSSVIEDALREVVLPEGRLTQVTLPWCTIIDDSYNANPLSMKLGLDTLAGSDCSRKVAILGQMAELGDEVQRYHAEIGAYARERADMVIGVGENSKGYGADAWFEDADACAAAIDQLVRPGDCILIKGSLVARMSKIVERLQLLAEGEFVPGLRR